MVMATHNLEHTPEPWRFIEREVMEDGSIYPRHILGGNNDLRVCMLESERIATMITEGKFDVLNDVGYANARRITAAVNACENIPTSSLEFMYISGETPIKAIDRLREEANTAWQQRDELLAALKRLIVSANTVDGCYIRNPGNFASALAEMKLDAKAAQELVTTMEAK